MLLNHSINMHSVFLLSFGLTFLLIPCQSNDSPGFFLKITKNVPRLGRRSEESYFMKNWRQIPRIGRSGPVSSHLAAADLLAWFDGKLSPSKRMLLSPAAMAAANEREYSVVQPVNSNTLIELLEKNAIPSDHVKFVHWKDFDRALQMDTDLYAKVVSLGRKPDLNLKADLGVGSYIPLLSDNSNDDGVDFMLYNKGADGDTFSDKYGQNFLRYNSLG